MNVGGSRGRKMVELSLQRTAEKQNIGVSDEHTKPDSLQAVPEIIATDCMLTIFSRNMFY